jgi:hypothetical protein
MVITCDLSVGELVADGRRIECWSKVRNELNGLRPKPGRPDVFRATLSDGSDGPPAMPRPFPAGEWSIIGIKPHPDRLNDPYLWPFYIGTDAHQNLEIWSLRGDGFYDSQTGEYVDDYAYGLHFSSSDVTTGCIRIATEADLRYLVDLLRPRIGQEELRIAVEA